MLCYDYLRSTQCISHTRLQPRQRPLMCGPGYRKRPPHWRPAHLPHPRPSHIIIHGNLTSTKNTTGRLSGTAVPLKAIFLALTCEGGGGGRLVLSFAIHLSTNSVLITAELARGCRGSRNSRNKCLLWWGFGFATSGSTVAA